MSAISLSQYLSIRKNNQFAIELIRVLSEKYDFDSVDAMNYLNVNEGKKVGKKVGKKSEDKIKNMVPNVLLPFCGVVNDSWCEGVRLNHNLFIQCTNERAGELYCKTCEKQASANSSGKPTYGNINDRRLSDVTINKKRVSHYGNVMERLNISREEAVLEASRFGWTIPEEQFGVKKLARGRAKKLVDTKEKKCEKVSSGRGRGRPKSDKKTVNSSASNDLIGELVTKAKSRIEFEDESNSEVDVVTTSSNDRVIEQLGSEIFAEVLSEVVSEVPYEIVDEVLSDISGAEIPAEIPAESPAEIPAESPAEIPAESPAEIPASIAASISEPVTVAEVVTEKSKSSKESKSQLKAKKEAEKAAEKARKKAEKEAEKAAEKEAEKSRKKAEKEAEKAAEKEAEKARKKAEKAVAKAVIKSQAKLEKESTKLQKKPVTKEVKTPDTIVSAVATEQSQDVSTSNSEEDDSEEEVKKQDTIVSAVAAEQSQDVSRSNSEEDSEEEEVEVEVKTWHHKCKKYLKSSNNKVYDIKTQEQIGIWNEEEDTIEENSEDEEEDSD
jgi:hypothetical protein